MKCRDQGRKTGNDKSANWGEWGRRSGNAPVRDAGSLDFSVMAEVVKIG